MKRGGKAALITALRTGPVPSTDWERFFGSRKSMHVTINLLKRAGWKIDSILKGERRDHYPAPQPPVEYVLVAEPEHGG